MPWIIRDGKPVRVSPEVSTSLPPQEVQATEMDTGIICSECGREFKTERGLATHTTAKH